MTLCQQYQILYDENLVSDKNTVFNKNVNKHFDHQNKSDDIDSASKNMQFGIPGFINLKKECPNNPIICYKYKQSEQQNR